MAAEITSDRIRNIVLAGHGGSGKTTLAEAMLYAARETSRMGTIQDGTTVSDYHQDEISRGISITMAVMHAHWKDHKINIIDVPGFPDFIGEVKSAVRVADSMVMTVDASTGVGFGADSSWEFALESNLPVMFVLTKVGVEQAHFEETVEYLRDHFSRDIVPLEYPLYENKKLVATVDILSMKCLRFRDDGSGGHDDSDVPPEVGEWCGKLRETLIETLAESDEGLMNSFFENGTLEEDQIRSGLKAAVASRRIFPLFAVSSTGNVGVTPLMDFIVEYAPSPVDVPVPVGAGENDAPVELSGSQSADPVLFVFKTISEPHVGELSFFRVFSGKISCGLDLVNTSTGVVERLNQLFAINGKGRKEASALHYGDIGAVVKLKNTHTNNTLAPRGKNVKIPTIWFPAPIADAAVVLKGKGDESKVSEGLHMMHEEDPTFNVYIDPESHQTVISGLGELHLDVIMKRLQSKYNIEVELKAPRIPYRETIRGSATTSYRHRKQTGGSGQFAEVHIYVEPWEEGRPVPSQFQVRGEELEELSWGGKFHFVNSIVGGSIDARFVPAVRKGVHELLQRGAYAGYPVTNVRVVLFDGKMHAVDSNENAFKTASKHAFKQAFRECRPQLMEPIWEIEIAAPMDYMGDIMGDLSSRRGRIMGMDTRGSSQVIRAQVPLSELYGYAARLRSLTQGRGSYSRGFSHYEEVPKEAESKIVAGAELEEVEE